MSEPHLSTTPARSFQEVTQPQCVPHIMTATLIELAESTKSTTYAISPPLWNNTEASIRRMLPPGMQDYELYITKAYDNDIVDNVAVWIPRGDRTEYLRWSRIFWGRPVNQYTDSEGAEKATYRAVAHWVVSPQDHEQHLIRPDERS